MTDKELMLRCIEAAARAYEGRGFNNHNHVLTLGKLFFAQCEEAETARAARFQALREERERERAAAAQSAEKVTNAEGDLT